MITSLNTILAVLFLTNLKLTFLNHQPVTVDRRLLKQLQEGSPLSPADLDSAAFLSLQDLRSPKYASTLDQFMVETMEAEENDKEAFEMTDKIQTSFHRQVNNINQEHEYNRASAYNRIPQDLFSTINARPSVNDPFANPSNLRLGRHVDLFEAKQHKPSQISNQYYLPEASSYRSGGANNKLQELNKSYQQYINYLQYQSHVKQQQQLAESTAAKENTDEQQESADEPECLITMTPADFYGRLLSLELSSVVYRGKPDALVSKIITLQAFARGLLVRRRLQLKLILDKAATFLQAYFRGHRVRARVTSALKQLHKCVVEEEKRLALLEAAEIGKNVAKEQQKLLSPVEEKILALEEENKKMREKLDQQNELMLSLLASQNLNQMNVSNRLLSELKNDISTLKENSKKTHPEETKKKSGKKEKIASAKPRKNKGIEPISNAEDSIPPPITIKASQDDQKEKIIVEEIEKSEPKEQEAVVQEHIGVDEVIKEEPEEASIDGISPSEPKDQQVEDQDQEKGATEHLDVDKETLSHQDEVKAVEDDQIKKSGVTDDVEVQSTSDKKLIQASKDEEIHENKDEEDKIEQEDSSKDGKEEGSDEEKDSDLEKEASEEEHGEEEDSNDGDQTESDAEKGKEEEKPQDITVVL